MTSIVGQPLYMSSPRIGSNSAVDFLFFIVNLLEREALKQGDILVLDNASVHYTHTTGPLLDVLLSAKGVKMYFLPCYSPELSPVELVFSQVKRHART
jgi:transposase